MEVPVARRAGNRSGYNGRTGKIIAGMTLRRKRLTKAAANKLIQRLQSGAETPLSVQVAEPGYRDTTRDLYLQVVEACIKHEVAEEEYSQLVPNFTGMKKTFPIEVSLTVPWDPENDPDGKAWVRAVESAARTAALAKLPDLSSKAAKFRKGGSFPLLSDGQAVLGARKKPRSRDTTPKLRAQIFVLWCFKKMPTDEIRKKLGLPRSLSRQAIESAAKNVAAQLKVQIR